ncbi:MAG: glycosyltransferase [Acidobacteriota bacterium]
MPAVSIILRARNEAAWLPEVLSSLSSQTIKDTEWILVDHGSTDATARIAQAAGARVLSLAEENFSYGRALNFGFEAARSPIAVSLSAHATPTSRRWLELLLLALDDPGVAASFGPEWPRPDADAVVRRGLRDRYSTGQPRMLDPHGRLTFGNTNAAVRIDVWQRFRFDEEIPYAEDLEWSLRVMEAGHRLLFTPHAAVYHSHREPPASVYRRAFAEGRAARLLRRPQLHHRLPGLCSCLLAGSLRDAGTLVLAGAPAAEWKQALVRRWCRSLGGWRGYRDGRAG